LVEGGHAPVYRLALRTVGGVAEGEDAVQETFARAWSALRGGARPESALGWLLGIARHVSLDQVRARRSASRSIEPGEVDRLASLIVDPQPGPRELVESAELSAAVRRVVDRLPDKHRVILLLREVDGLSYDELAAALGCPIGTVESRLFRARAALAKQLDRLLAR
jgi:RNA polymerase sigma-70 factor (ECF subfamily)